MTAQDATVPAAALAVDRLVEQLRCSRWVDLQDCSLPWVRAVCALLLAQHRRIDTAQILNALPDRTHGIDFPDVLNTLANLGFAPATMRLDLVRIDARLCPCLFLPDRDPDAPWAVLGRTDEGLSVFDPTSQQMRTIALEDLGGATAGRAIVVPRQPTADALSAGTRRAGSELSWFRTLLTRFRGLFWQIMATGLLLNITALALPIFIMLVYDQVIGPGVGDTLHHLVFGVVLAVCAEILMRDKRSQGVSWLAGRLDNIVGNQIFARLVGLPPAEIERATVAAQVARIKTFESVRDFFSGPLFLSLLEMPFVLVSFTAMAVVGGWLAVVPLVAVLTYIALFAWVRRPIRVAIRTAAKASSARQRFAIETFEKLAAIRCNGMVELWRRKYRQCSGRECMAHMRLRRLGGMVEVAALSITLLAGVATVALGVHMVWAGALSSGGLVAGMILVWRIVAPFQSLCMAAPRFEQLRSSIAQVNALMDLPLETESAQASRLAGMRGDVSIRNVEMRYGPGDDPALSNVSFDVPAGALVALTGGNGAGKSTVLKLAKGLYRANAGAVMIDGVDVRQLHPVDLRRQVAYMPQVPYFFGGTVLENLLAGSPLAAMPDVERVLVACGVADDIDALPAGLQTRIGDDGGHALTSGMAARLSLARTLLQDTQIVLIDEVPNSVMSGTSGQRVLDHLRLCRPEATVFIVTHREDILAMADMTVVLKRGAPAVVAARSSAVTLEVSAA